jgi:hypothetical protein
MHKHTVINKKCKIFQGFAWILTMSHQKNCMCFRDVRCGGKVNTGVVRVYFVSAVYTTLHGCRKDYHL